MLTALIEATEAAFVLCMSISYLSQVVEICRKKHGNGYSLNFQWLNTFGHLFYFIYSSYDLKHNKVFVEALFDWIYAFVTLSLNIILISLTYNYPHSENQSSLVVFGFILVVLVVPVVFQVVNL